MQFGKKVRGLALSAMIAVLAIPAGAATVGSAFNLEFEATPSATYGSPLDPGFSLADVLTATVTQTADDTARFDFFFGGDFEIVPMFLDENVELDSFSGGDLLEDMLNARNGYGDVGIPRGISFDNGRAGFQDGDVLSFTLSLATGLDVADLDSFLHSGSSSGLFGAVGYRQGSGSYAFFGLTGTGEPAIAAVPLPAGGLLLIGGMGLLLVMRRKTS